MTPPPAPPEGGEIGMVFISALMFWEIYGDLFDFEHFDSVYYDYLGKQGHKLLVKGGFRDKFEAFLVLPISDQGYPIYIAFMYYLFNDSVILLRLVKAIFGAWTCLLIYKLGSREFGTKVKQISIYFPKHKSTYKNPEDPYCQSRDKQFLTKGCIRNVRPFLWKHI